MECDILDALVDLGNSISSMNVVDNKQRCTLPNEDNFACLRCSGIVEKDDDIKEVIEIGTKSIVFTQLVEWLSKELQALNDMESCINAITDPEDSSSFLMEVSSFLKELHCPYKSLMDGPISQRLLDVQSRITFLDYLCTELLAARLFHSKKKKVKNVLEIEVDDSSTAICLHDSMKALNINVANVILNPSSCFSEIENKVKAILDTDSEVLSPPVITETLSDSQWESLNMLYEDFFSDYTVRRKLLLTRLDVTIQSFTWGENNKGKENKILDAFLCRSKKLKQKPVVKLSDVIAAREDLLVVEKTSSANLVKNTKSSVNRILIDAVPDRGGRPKEQRPAREMPNWMKRTKTADHFGGTEAWQGGKKIRRIQGDLRGRGKKNRGNQGNRGGRGKQKGQNKKKGHKEGRRRN